MNYRRIIFPISITAFIANFTLISYLKWEIVDAWFYLDVLLSFMPIILMLSFIKVKKNHYAFGFWLFLFAITFGAFWYLKNDLAITEFGFASFAPIAATLIMLYYSIICYLLSTNSIDKKNRLLGYFTKKTKEYPKELFLPSNKLLSIMYFSVVVLEIILIFFFGIAFKYFVTLALLVVPFVITYLNEKYLYEKIKKGSS